MDIFCIKCGRTREGLEIKCKYCGSPFHMRPNFPFSKKLRENFPYIRDWVSLGEGNTPTIRIKGFPQLKLDFLNPTGSYKDRGSVTLVSWIRQNGIREISEDSSGNAGSSIAAYGSSGGMKVKVFVPERSSGIKVRQAQLYGAEVVKVKGDREKVAEAAEKSGLYYASHTLVPEFRDGIRTLPYELSRVKPRRVYLPVSAGTLLMGVYEGFVHLLESGEIEELPLIVASQIEQVSPLCARIKGYKYTPPVVLTTKADALVSTKPVLMSLMERTISKAGDCVTVKEEEMLEAWDELRSRGILVEYSSAVGYAAWKKSGGSEEDVVVLTGSGLKTI